MIKPNFSAAWEEVGDEHELEDTYALSSIKSLDGEFGGKDEFEGVWAAVGKEKWVFSY